MDNDPIALLRALVETARPAFPKTPYRIALDKAKQFLLQLDNGEQK